MISCSISKSRDDVEAVDGAQADGIGAVATAIGATNAVTFD